MTADTPRRKRRDLAGPEYPASAPMPPLPEGAACVGHPHPEWWSASLQHGEEALGQARAAARVCASQCPAEVFKVCGEIALLIRPCTGVFAGVGWVSGSRGSAVGRPSQRDLLTDTPGR